MDYDPFEELIDEPLRIDKETLRKLVSLRDSEIFSELPGSIPGEKEWLSGLLIKLINYLVSGIEENPSKGWVMQQFKPSLEELYGEDTEARDHYGDHLELIMDILDIESSDGILSFYL